MISQCNIHYQYIISADSWRFPGCKSLHLLWGWNCGAAHVVSVLIMLCRTMLVPILSNCVYSRPCSDDFLPQTLSFTSVVVGVCLLLSSACLLPPGASKRQNFKACSQCLEPVFSLRQCHHIFVLVCAVDGADTSPVLQLAVLPQILKVLMILNLPLSLVFDNMQILHEVKRLNIMTRSDSFF